MPVVIASVSLGYVFGVSRGQKLPSGFINLYDEYEKISYSAVALHMRTDFYVTDKLGFTVFANINEENSCTGFLLCGRIELFK